MRCIRFLLALCFCGLGGAQQTSTIDFESLTEGQAAVVPGYTFSNAVVLQSGASLNEIEFPPHSGTKVVCDVGGAMTITFNNPVTKFSGYFTHGQKITIRALAQNGGIGAQAVSTLDNRAGTGGTPNELLQVEDASGITKVVIESAAAGSSFTLDDIGITAFTPPRPTFFLDTPRLTFDAVFGRQAPPAQNVTLTAEPDVSFTFTSSVPWLKANASRNTTPANIAITANSVNMDPGTYTGSVSFTSSRNATLILSVTLRIVGKPALTSSPTSFTFKYKKGDPAPAAQQLYISALNANVDYFILTKDPWVKVTPDFATTGNLSLRHQVVIDPSKLDPGHYESAIFVYSNEASNSPLTIPVIVDVVAVSAGGNN
jgi:hypothetical protein